MMMNKSIKNRRNAKGVHPTDRQASKGKLPKHLLKQKERCMMVT